MAKREVTKMKMARARITDPKNWTQKAYARNDIGEDVGDWNLPEVVCWCAEGAMLREGVSLRGFEAFEAVVNTLSIPEFNDGPMTTHQDVLNAFDKAIQILEGK